MTGESKSTVGNFHTPITCLNEGLEKTGAGIMTITSLLKARNNNAGRYLTLKTR